MRRGNSIIGFHHVFVVTFYAVTLQKLFFTGETKILISLKRYFQHYIHRTYLHKKAHLGLHSNNQTTLLKTKTIFCRTVYTG